MAHRDVTELWAPIPSTTLPSSALIVGGNRACNSGASFLAAAGAHKAVETNRGSMLPARRCLQERSRIWRNGCESLSGSSIVLRSLPILLMNALKQIGSNSSILRSEPSTSLKSLETDVHRLIAAVNAFCFATVPLSRPTNFKPGTLLSFSLLVSLDEVCGQLAETFLQANWANRKKLKMLAKCILQLGSTSKTWFWVASAWRIASRVYSRLCNQSLLGSQLQRP